MNGWKIKTWEGDHQLTINGNFYTEDGSDPFVPTDQRWNIVIRNNVSSLPETSQGQGQGPCPTADEVADAVRTELSLELSRIDTTISSRASQTSVNSIASDVTDIKTSVQNIEAVCGNVEVDLAQLLALMQLVRKMDTNRTRIDVVQKTLTVYDDDDFTPLVVFALKDSTGAPSVEQVCERVPL